MADTIQAMSLPPDEIRAELIEIAANTIMKLRKDK